MFSPEPPPKKYVALWGVIVILVALIGLGAACIGNTACLQILTGSADNLTPITLDAPILNNQLSDSTANTPSYATQQCEFYEQTGVGQTATISLNIPDDWVVVIDAVQVGGYSDQPAVVSISAPVPDTLNITDGAICGVRAEWREWAENERLYWARTHIPNIRLIRF